MITVSSLTDPGSAPQTRAGHCLAASLDVEWTKNYRVRNGNRPFCCSVVYLDLPGDRPADLSTAAFEYVSVYLEPDGHPAWYARLSSYRDALSPSVTPTAQVSVDAVSHAVSSWLQSVITGEAASDDEPVTAS